MVKSANGAADSAGGDPPDVPSDPHRRRVWGWAALAGLVLVTATVASAGAADTVATNNATRSRQDLKASAAQVASTLQLAIQHEEDLIVSAGAFAAGDAGSSNGAFASWAASVQALARYPELQGIGTSVIVPASQLQPFVARTSGDPVGPAPAAPFQITPPGDRPFYCLTTGSIARSTETSFPAGYDFCYGNAGTVQLAARDSGLSAYLPIQNGQSTFLSVLTPIYRPDEPVTTVSARQNAFLGWVGMEVQPRVVLDRSLVGQPNMAVSMRYGAGTSHADFRTGKVPVRAQAVTTDLHNGWTVVSYGTVASGGVVADSSALAVFLAGMGLGVLLAALVLVLATGRVRALRLVSAKTDQLRHQALHDALTGLPNRALIADRIAQLLARNRRNGTSGAALYIDLDGFKNVNDTLGHAAGDRLLVAVAARLAANLRDADTIGRMGGDEFVVLVDGVSLQGAPQLVAQRVLEVLRQPFTVDGAPTPIMTTASVGIALGYRSDPEGLLRDADVALYQAKAAGKNCYEIFRPEMETAVQYRYELEFDLRAALDDDQFRLVYQPIYNLDDLSLIGVEALIRWEHPTRGEIQPSEFIPLLESSGQIIDVGRWVLLEACTQMAAWRSGGNDIMVAVNVSGRQLDRDVIVEQVRDALDASGLEPDRLTIEVTETALMRNVEATARRLSDLKALGVQIAIDDFGTGYSSLAYLQHFPVDCLKIDQSFTGAIARSPESDALIRTFVQLGKDLGLRTLAEGVETIGQLDRLRDEHVDEAQGFLLARPLTPGILETQILGPARTAQPTPE